MHSVCTIFALSKNNFDKAKYYEGFFFNTIQEFNDYIGVKMLHHLVSVARVENTTPIQEAVHHYGLYALFLKGDRKNGEGHN